MNFIIISGKFLNNFPLSKIFKNVFETQNNFLLADRLKLE
jgi:hypothetical protein